ncbi:MAG: hypothetical protein KA149_06465 [Chitinophagales bacterium]|nr:hypothetical protein [Chitinophagales bacterium]
MRNKNILIVLKIALLVLMVWFIADRLFINNDFKGQVNLFKQNFNGGKFYLFVWACLLMPVNWLLETVKWRMLTKSTEPFMHLLKSVIAGTTLGFVTPGRSGEFVGRVLFVADENKARIFYLSSIGGIAQSVATLVTGVFFVFMWTDNSFFNGITIGLAAAFTFLYFRFDLLNRFISSNTFLQNNNLLISHDDLPGIGTQLAVLGMSFIRFSVYLFQYVLLLMFFGVSDNFYLLLVHSGVFLVAQTFSPVMPFVDLSYRGGTALYVFSHLANTLGVLSGVMGVWFINLVIPSIVGYFFILSARSASIGRR